MENNPSWPPPVPTKSRYSIMWTFFGLGTANGLIWCVFFERIMAPLTAHMIIWVIVAFVFSSQAITAYRDERELRRWREEYESWLKNQGMVKVRDDRD